MSDNNIIPVIYQHVFVLRVIHHVLNPFPDDPLVVVIMVNITTHHLLPLTITLRIQVPVTVKILVWVTK